MTETKDREIFSRIPMRTWRWLGVNESEWPEHVAENAKLDVLRAGVGETKEYVDERKCTATIYGDDYDYTIDDSLKITCK